MSHDALQVIREEHSAIAAMLRSLGMLIRFGPGEKPQRFFETVRWMLFYIDEFPEQHHHRNESQFLFPLLMTGAPELKPVIDRLEIDHENGERRVRELQHLLAAWEVIGESRRPVFESAFDEYLHFYLDHMRIEETKLLPVAQRLLSGQERRTLDERFGARRDPLAGGPHAPEYDRLFSRIVQKAPAPIGLGDE